ncbi:MAG TPA: MarR family transcriptional regulator [Patescibacteria group bacterium]|nr:MarR family transcriptional regulator [Patescibacteria group bacterium]
MALRYTIRDLPRREGLRRFAEQIPEVDVSAVELLVQFLQTSSDIQYTIFDILERKYKLSEGKLVVMIILYHEPEGIAPSKLAEKACVTRATISAMLHRMVRDKLAWVVCDSTDGRGKLVALTERGRSLMDEILPGHFLRTAQLMKNLTEEERHTLIGLLKKIDVS